MRFIKAVSLCSFAIFLAYLSADLLRQLLQSSPESYSPFQTLIVACIFNFFVTGVFALPGFVFPTSKLVPNKYYEITKPGLLKGLYKKFGVAIFRRLLMVIFWGRKYNRQKYFDGTRTGLSNLLFQSKQSEFGHLSSFLALISISLVLVIYNYFQLVFVIAIFNVLTNFYPILLQRHHRMRVDRIITISGF